MLVLEAVLVGVLTQARVQVLLEQEAPTQILEHQLSEVSAQGVQALGLAEVFPTIADHKRREPE